MSKLFIVVAVAAAIAVTAANLVLVKWFIELLTR